MKLADIKDNVTARQKLILVITFLILIIVLFSVLKILSTKKEGIDYKNTDYNTLIFESSETSDRNIYWTLNGILISFLESYQTVENMDISELIEYKYSGYSLEEYYDALDVNYKKFLGKKEYISLCKNMMSKMVTWNENGFNLKTENIIRKIYKLKEYNDAYLCELNTVESGESAYVGIILDQNSKKYNIFYIQ